MKVWVAQPGEVVLDAGLPPLGLSTRWIRTDTTGRFHCAVPCGSYEAWIGTPSELEGGEPRRRIPIVVTPEGVRGEGLR